MKSLNKPTTKQVEKVVSLLVHPEQYRYFFDNLENPEWIELLWNKGYFQNPIPPIVDEKRGTTAFPSWPESKYLARMSKQGHYSELILSIILKVKTNNIRIYEDFLACFNSMPTALSKKAVDLVKSWIEGNHYWTLPDVYTEYVNHLAIGGATNEALKVAESLLDILPDPRIDNKKDKNGKYIFSPDPICRFDDWHYGEILKKMVPILSKTCKTEVLILFCKLLEKNIVLSMTDVKSKPEDYSGIWRPIIEKEDENYGHNSKGLLIDAVISTSETLFQNDPTSTSQIFGLLFSIPWKTFQRIGYYLLGKYSQDTVLIGQKIIEPISIDDHSLRREHRILLKNKYSEITPENQSAYLELVDKGPDVKLFKERFQQFRGKAPSSEEVNKHINNWKADYLQTIVDQLSEEWKKKYESFINKAGKPQEIDERHFTSGTWVGPTSPLKKEELIKMDSKTLFDFLLAWKPSGGIESPSREGLGRELSSIISEAPEQYEEIIAELSKLHPTFVRFFIQGFKEAMKKGYVPKWDLLFSLFEWVMQQPIDYNNEKESWGEDIGWKWTRNRVIEVISEGVNNEKSGLNFLQRERVWNIIAKLTDDPDPQEDQNKGTKNAATRSINTNRGEAMHAVIKYALWVRRNIDKEKGGQSHGFGDMPEVETVLNDHLLHDPSPTIRSVYGQWLPWLLLLDKKWLKQHKQDIFPKEGVDSTLWRVAWSTYIAYCQPYRNVLEVINDQFNYALTVIQQIDEDKDMWEFDHCASRLVEHLMVYYWHGDLGLEKDSLIDTFYRNANDKLKTRALEFIGRNLEDTSTPLEKEVSVRLKNLFEWRLKVHQENKKANMDSEELTSFGWWFISDRFDKEWLINNLIEVLKLAKKVDADWKIVEKLQEYASEFPEQVMMCLNLIITGDKEGWSMLDWGNDLRPILEKAMRDKSEKAKLLAREVINNLGKKGIFNYKDLL